MKSKMKKMMAVGLSAIILLIPNLSFADESTAPTEKILKAEGRLNGRLGEKTGDRSVERLSEFKDGIKERAGEASEKKEVSRERLTNLINQYAPDLLVDFQNFWTAHDHIHQQLMAERERIMEAKKEESITFNEMIKAKVSSGEMTREEAKVEIEAFRAVEKTERESVKAEFDTLKETLDVPKEVIEKLHESLKAAAEAGDSEAVTETLEEMISYHPQHLVFDQAKLELMMTK